MLLAISIASEAEPPSSDPLSFVGSTFAFTSAFVFASGSAFGVAIVLGLDPFGFSPLASLACIGYLTNIPTPPRSYLTNCVVPPPHFSSCDLLVTRAVYD